ncbi:MAG TPA: hypothetical protein VNN07_19390 [Candidatus Tectomicrobia bacterium]|nr:hypothetical protein [Candidatus Tectomicrobia bacterium]
MIFPLPPLGLVVASVILYRHLARVPATVNVWQRAAAVALVVTVVRVAGTWIGWFTLQATSGRLQLPAYILILLSWPEVALAPGVLKRPGVGHALGPRA